MGVFRLGIAFLVLDQLSKYAALRFLDPSVPVIPNIFHLTLVRNTGGAFGILTGQTFLFLVVGVLTILFILIQRRILKQAPHGVRWAAALILGGASGNLVDRIRFGYVVDFLDFRVWPVFNIADSCITVGTFLLVWNLLSKDVARPS